MSMEYKIPVYAKITIILIGLVIVLTTLYIARDIIVPLVFAVILSIVLHPVVNFLSSKGMNRIVAISITLLLALLVIAALGFFLFSQASRFSE